MALEPPATPDDADTDTETDEVLPCGVLLADAWDAGQPPAGHDTCPHCLDAVAEVAVLRAVVVEAVAPHGGGEAGSADFAARVMDIVRAELRPGPLVPLGPLDGFDGSTGGIGESGEIGEPADDWITEAAAARVLRAAAEREPGVWAGSCRIRPIGASDHAYTPQRLPREPLRVRIEVAVTPALRLTDTAEQVRLRVLDAADRELGIEVAAVDVAVVELRDEEPPVPNRRNPR